MVSFQVLRRRRFRRLAIMSQLSACQMAVAGLSDLEKRRS
jgi:hypothetical protein